MVLSQSGRPEKKHLAQVHHCTYMKRVDSRTGGYIIQQIPRAKVTDAQAELTDFANLMDCCLKACGDQPPLVLATDCHLSYELCQKLLLGQLQQAAYKDLPGLRHLKPASKPIHLPMFAFQCLVYKSDTHPVFGSSDAKHIIKAVSRAVRCASRCFQMCHGWHVLTMMIADGSQNVTNHREPLQFSSQYFKGMVDYSRGLLVFAV